MDCGLIQFGLREGQAAVWNTIRLPIVCRPSIILGVLGICGMIDALLVSPHVPLVVPLCAISGIVTQGILHTLWALNVLLFHGCIGPGLRLLSAGIYSRPVHPCLFILLLLMSGRID